MFSASGKPQGRPACSSPMRPEGRAAIIPTRHSAFQFNLKQLKGFIAQILRQVGDGVLPEDLPSLHTSLLCFPVWIREPTIEVSQKNAHRRRVRMHDRLLTRSIADPNHAHPLILELYRV